VSFLTVVSKDLTQAVDEAVNWTLMKAAEAVVR